jgi:hypothetical protein
MWLARFAGREAVRRLVRGFRALRADWCLVGEMYDQINRERRRNG